MPSQNARQALSARRLARYYGQPVPSAGSEELSRLEDLASPEQMEGPTIHDYWDPLDRASAMASLRYSGPFVHSFWNPLDRSSHPTTGEAAGEPVARDLDHRFLVIATLISWAVAISLAIAVASK